MKKYSLIALLILTTTILFSQNKEKIKGSKTVTLKSITIESFNTIEINDNIEVYLERGEVPALKIEADDNLQDIISTDLKENTLLIYTTKEPIKFKKLIVHITYTNDLLAISSKGNSVVNAIQELLLEKIDIKSYDNSKLFLNVNSKDFLLESNDKSKVELNLKSDKSKIILSQNSNLKSLISSNDILFDMYQKSDAKIEGSAVNGTLRLDNNASFIGNKFTVKNLSLATESYSSAYISVGDSIQIDAKEKSEIQLVGNPKIEILNFSDEAKLQKKLK